MKEKISESWNRVFKIQNRQKVEVESGSDKISMLKKK